MTLKAAFKKIATPDNPIVGAILLENGLSENRTATAPYTSLDKTSGDIFC